MVTGDPGRFVRNELLVSYARAPCRGLNDSSFRSRCRPGRRRTVRARASLLSPPDWAVIHRDRRGRSSRRGVEAYVELPQAVLSRAVELAAGRLMSGGTSYYPTRREALEYLADYEARYDVPIVRPIRVNAVRGLGNRLGVYTDAGVWRARAVVSATGTWSSPNVPQLPGQDRFRGRVLHSARYASPDEFLGKRVVIVGGGNSGAQIVGDLFERATVTWATRSPPKFLPDDVDGRYLFGEETTRYHAMTEGAPPPPQTLGDIVMVESVRRARDRGALRSTPMFVAFTERGVAWPDGRETREDAVIFATGFRPALAHLASLELAGPNGKIETRGTRSVREDRLWLVGYGDWTGYASATLIGVGRTARATVDEIARTLENDAR